MQQTLAVTFLALICILGAAAQNNDTLSDNPPDSNCSSIPSPCGWNATCNDTEEGPVCYCDIGYWINNITYDCEMCPWGTWGEDCAYECNCTNLDNTTTCHHVNGSCPDDGIFNCDDDPCEESALCRNVNDTYECYCTSGYQLVNETSCEECSWNTWGFNCSGTCNCTDNTTTCNTVTGLCPEDEINCASNPCGMNALCVDIRLGVYQCYCPSGYILIDDYDCVECPGGTYGPNCTENCTCGTGGNGCHHITGNCSCNACYSGDTCELPEGSDCIRDFLEISEKCELDLKDMFGGYEYPQPPDDSLTNLAVELMELDNAVVIQTEPNFEGMSREDVDQGPLVKLTWRVDKNADRVSAEAGLERLAEQVKLGNIRSTLIINSRQEAADVTLNSGIRRCEDDNS